MAAGKVQYIFRQLPAITGSSWNAGVLTVNFAAAHQLIAGNTFRVNGAGTQNFTTTVYTVAGVAGSGDSRLASSQREPGVSKKKNPTLGYFRRKPPKA